MKQRTKYFTITSQQIGDCEWSQSAAELLDWFYDECLLEGLHDVDHKDILNRITNNLELHGEILAIIK